MYYPYLRGRQNELLGLQELLDAGKLGGKVVPVIEPVKFSSTFINTLRKFVEKGHPLILIKNPGVGKFDQEYREAQEKHEGNPQLMEQYKTILRSEYIKDAFLTTREVYEKVINGEMDNSESIYLINTEKGDYRYYEEHGDAINVRASFIPGGDPDFKDEVEGDCIWLDDTYKKKKRNVDYIEEPDEFFSKSHLKFEKRGYQGFSDYSIVGNEYEESGFAPVAVAIHIVYFTDRKALNVHHFVSDTNLNFKDPAGKFAEAMVKLMDWEGLEAIRGTKGIEGLISYYEKEKFPGLGVIKKFSIMHHLELMGKYLGE